MNVTATAEIRTPRGLKIAEKGTVGRVVDNARPRSSDHWNKVLVIFDGHTRGYWCPPDNLSFPRNVDPTNIVAQPSERDPYKGVPKLPVFRGEHQFHFGINLKTCRRARRLSQVELAKRMRMFGPPVAQSTICYRENQPVNPGGHFVQAAAKALTVPPFIFFVDLQRCKAYVESKKFLNGCSSSICT